MAAKQTQRWVLLRGLGREARHWGDFPGRLTAALGEARVLTPDLPGNGQHWQAASATRIEAQTTALRAALGTELQAGPVNVIAISLGGMVALDWASRFPTEVDRLVLISTSLAGLAPFWQRLRWQRYPALLQLLFQPAAAREAGILALTSNRPERAAQVLGDWQRWQAEAPVSSRNLLRQLWAAARFRPPAHWPACAGLLLASAQDGLVDPRCSQALAVATGWPLALHAQAGHDLPLDAADWLVEQIVLWINEAAQEGA